MLLSTDRAIVVVVVVFICCCLFRGSSCVHRINALTLKPPIKFVAGDNPKIDFFFTEKMTFHVNRLGRRFT